MFTLFNYANETPNYFNYATKADLGFSLYLTICTTQGGANL